MKIPVFAAFACLIASQAGAQPPKVLVVLRPTGEMRNSLPVLAVHPRGPAVGAVLTGGYSGRLLRLYALQQEYLHRRMGEVPEPAYLLLSNRQGGFPEFGFVLDGVQKPAAGYVDLHRTKRLTGAFGAMDQIFPHELLHIIARQLAGAPRDSGANQVHAIGVRTDPVQAFTEGFAEHAQVMAIDDPDAAGDTQALVEDVDRLRRARKETSAFAGDLTARLLLVSPSRMRFLLWFSQSEQVQRYWDVKANAFARAPAIPEQLLRQSDPYPAYLLRSVVPGSPGDTVKSAAEMLSTEGVVAHLFWRLVTSLPLGERMREDAFYELFGTRPSELTPAENIYLKIFHVLHAGRPSDTATFLRAYVTAFPDEAPAIEALVLEVLHGQPLPDAPEIWLANEAFHTGTSLFDQFRALPRPHTFDANAASVFDWVAVPGVTRDAAAELLRRAPYRRLEDLTAATWLDPALRVRIQMMSAAMADVARRASEEAESLSLEAIILPYVWRLLVIVAVSAVAGAGLARRVGVAHWWSACVMSTLATLMVLTLSWVVISDAWIPLAAPVVAGGVPAAVWRLSRHRSARQAAQVMAAWAVAALPAVLVSRAWF